MDCGLEMAEACFDVSVLSVVVRFCCVCGDHEQTRIGIESLERHEVARVGRLEFPFAFHGDGRKALAGEYEVEFVFLFVPPMIDLACLEMGAQLIENKVFPESAKILLAEVAPAPGVADEPGVESIDFGHGYDFTLAVA